GGTQTANAEGVVCQRVEVKSWGPNGDVAGSKAHDVGNRDYFALSSAGDGEGKAFQREQPWARNRHRSRLARQLVAREPQDAGSERNCDTCRHIPRCEGNLQQTGTGTADSGDVIN